jgi:hypothetical protein
MEGLDFAFYKGRSKYHTKYDSVPGTVGGEKALWAMMEAVRGAGSALVNDGSTHVGKVDGGEDPVYFDCECPMLWFAVSLLKLCGHEVFAAVLIVLPLRIMFTINIVLLTAGPILLLFLVYTKHVVMHRRLQQPDIAREEGAAESIWRRLWNSFKSLGWLSDLWRVGKFWLAVVLGIGLQVLLIVGYVNVNPFVSCFLFSFLVLRLIVKLIMHRSSILIHISSSYHHSPWHICQQSCSSTSPFPDTTSF